MKIKKNDNIIVLQGKDRGKTGIVQYVDKKNNKIAVKGINIIKKHQKKDKLHPQGGIIEKFSPIPISNTCIICPSCSKPCKVAYQIDEKSKKNKIRICKKCKGSLEKMETESNKK